MSIAQIGLSWGRAVASQLHIRMLMLTFLPFFVALLIWCVVMWFGMQALIDFVQQWFNAHNTFQSAGEILAMLGLFAFKAMVAPLVAMWLLLPLMIFTALLCIGLFAMPTINKHVGSRHYPDLEQRRGGSVIGSVWFSMTSFLLFAAVWLLTLPLTLFPVISLVLQPLLWGWLTYRVIVYDALAAHADVEERKSLLRQHRWQLLFIGTVAGLVGAAPGLLWLGGVVSVLFLPLMAGVAIWIYVLVFVFTGLWFQHYCLAALEQHRQQAEPT